MTDRNEHQLHKSEKMAGRANLSASNENTSKNPNAQFIPPVHQKKPLSKEEKQALRRQVNETENKYPKRN
ncbi:hypothetical protein [Solimicrobium silvestre]|nr:hypothetical protein [Solimicrobium silvestre]